MTRRHVLTRYEQSLLTDAAQICLERYDEIPSRGQLAAGLLEVHRG